MPLGGGTCAHVCVGFQVSSAGNFVGKENFEEVAKTFKQLKNCPAY